MIFNILVVVILVVLIIEKVIDFNSRSDIKQLKEEVKQLKENDKE